MLPQTERLVLRLKVPRYLRPIICCLALLSQIPASPVGKPHGNTFVITKTNICRIRPLHAWISDLAKAQICAAERKRIFQVPRFVVFLLCRSFRFLDSGTLPFISAGIIKKQLSVHNSSRRRWKSRIVFICRQIQIALHAVHWIWIWCKCVDYGSATFFVWKLN